MADAYLSYLQLLPPEIRTVLWGAMGSIAATAILVGLIMGLTGIKTARVGTGILIGAILALIGALTLPRIMDISPVTGGIVPGVVGLLLGIFLFRVLQAAAVAVCLAGIASGVYYHQYVWIPQHAAPAAHATAAAETPAADLQIALENLPAQRGPSERAESPAARIGTVARQAWNTIPPVDRRRLGLLAGAVALLGFLMAFGFPRGTSLVFSAVAGAALVLGGAVILMRVENPALMEYLPVRAGSYLLIGGLLALVGGLIQCRLFGRKADRSSQTTRQADPEAALRPA